MKMENTYFLYSFRQNNDIVQEIENYCIYFNQDQSSGTLQITFEWFSLNLGN